MSDFRIEPSNFDHAALILAARRERARVMRAYAGLAARTLAAMFRRAVTHMLMRRIVAELKKLDDRTLADLGIYHDGLAEVARRRAMASSAASTGNRRLAA